MEAKAELKAQPARTASKVPTPDQSYIYKSLRTIEPQPAHQEQKAPEKITIDLSVFESPLKLTEQGLAKNGEFKQDAETGEQKALIEKISDATNIPKIYVPFFINYLITVGPLATRPVAKRAKELLEREDTSGKRTDLHGKSAGPYKETAESKEENYLITGYVPVDQTFSKLTDGEITEKVLENVKHYSDENKESLKKLDGDQKLIMGEMVLTYGEEKEKGEVYGFKTKEGHPYKDKNGKKVFLVKKSDGKFYAKGDVTYDGIEKLLNATEEDIQKLGLTAVPIKVMCYNIDGQKKKAVPDVDMMSYGVRKEEAKTLGITDVDAVEDDGTKNPIRGILTKLSRIGLEYLCEKTKDKNLITHGAETENPCTEDDLECTFFIPLYKEKPVYEIRVCKTRKDILKAVNDCAKMGCRIGVSPNWGLQKKGDTLDGLPSYEINRVSTSIKSLIIKAGNLKKQKEEKAVIKLKKEAEKKIAKTKPETEREREEKRVSLTPELREKINALSKDDKKAFLEGLKKILAERKKEEESYVAQKSGLRAERAKATRKTSEGREEAKKATKEIDELKELKDVFLEYNKACTKYPKIDGDENIVIGILIKGEEGNLADVMLKEKKGDNPRQKAFKELGRFIKANKENNPIIKDVLKNMHKEEIVKRLSCMLTSRPKELVQLTKNMEKALEMKGKIRTLSNILITDTTLKRRSTLSTPAPVQQKATGTHGRV